MYKATNKNISLLIRLDPQLKDNEDEDAMELMKPSAQNLIQWGWIISVQCNNAIVHCSAIIQCTVMQCSALQC